MSFTVHPAQVEYLKKLRAGNKVVWHSSMEWLYCYGKRAPVMDLRLIWLPCYPDFDLGYTFDGKTGEWDRIKDKPAAIKFLSFHARLRDTNTILEAGDKDGNIPALAVLQDIEDWYEMRKESLGEVERELMTVEYWIDKARGFLEEEEILIPQKVWGEVLSAATQH